jgi:hypothetical protein
MSDDARKTKTVKSTRSTRTSGSKPSSAAPAEPSSTVPGDVEEQDIKYVSSPVTKEKTRFAFKRNKTTGNYSIYSADGGRIMMTLLGIYVPFGLEKYNSSEIINFLLESDNNYHYNMIVKLKDLDNELRILQTKNIDIDLTGLEYYPIISENKENEDDNDKNNDKNKNKNKKAVRYIIRTYLKNGAKVLHSKLFGTYDKTKLKGKRCDIDLELGSIWYNEKKYGCTLYVSAIKVTN